MNSRINPVVQNVAGLGKKLVVFFFLKSTAHIWKLKQSLTTPQRDSSNYPPNYQVEACKLYSQFTKKRQSRGEVPIYIINIIQIHRGHFPAHTKKESGAGDGICTRQIMEEEPCREKTEIKEKGL